MSQKSIEEIMYEQRIASLNKGTDISSLEQKHRELLEIEKEDCMQNFLIEDKKREKTEFLKKEYKNSIDCYGKKRYMRFNLNGLK